MNNLVAFKNENFGEIRTIEKDGKLLFCGNDVASALGYKRPNDAVTSHCKCTVKCSIPHPQSNSKTIDMLFISEGDVYRLIASCKLEVGEKFEHWIFDEVVPSITHTGSYSVLPTSQKSKEELAIADKEARSSIANIYLRLSEKYSGNKNYSQILDAYATKAIEDKFVLPLPKLEETNYSATEVGKMLGISSNKVGSIAKKLNLKTDGEYGHWYMDKSPYSSKEVNVFRYTQKAIDLIKKELA